jgi:hypothetical protein
MDYSNSSAARDLQSQIDSSVARLQGFYERELKGNSLAIKEIDTIRDKYNRVLAQATAFDELSRHNCDSVTGESLFICIIKMQCKCLKDANTVFELFKTMKDT